MLDVSNYEKLKEDARKFYSTVGKVWSPVLKEEVYFSADGFNHLIYKGARTERDRASQILRFKLLPLAAKLVTISTTHQEFEESIKEFEVKKFKKRIRQSKVVRYWGLIAIIENRKIKVIIRRIGDNGNLRFWSVVPAWVTNKYRDSRFFTTMKGNPDED